MRTLFRAGDRLYRTTDRTFLIVECRRCRLIRLSPQPSPEELSHYYPRDYWFVPESNAASRLEELYRRVVLRDHVNFVERAITSSGVDGPLLDIGCGGGLFLKLMALRGHSVAGLDFSLDAARAASKVNGVPAICGSLGHSPIRPGSCAAVTMFHVLEHLFDPASFLERAGRLLAPRGRLILQVPNASCWQFLLLGENWNGLDVPRHLIDFRAADLDVLLDTCGFEQVRQKHFSLRDNPAGFASSVAPWLDPMARRVRGQAEGPAQRLAKDLVYFGLVLAALPFTLLEAACRAGSTIMIEARKKD